MATTTTGKRAAVAATASAAPTDTAEPAADPGDAARGGLSPSQLAALRPHVIVTEDGRLSDSSTNTPKSANEFDTTAADIRRIFEKDLPAFIKAHPEGRVPIVVYAHGGLVDKGVGLATAHAQVDWWKDNGAYPIHVVWQSGMLTSISDVIRGRKPGTRGFTEVTDGVIEATARLLGGVPVWGDMKLDAAAGSLDGGGAAVLAEELAKFLKTPEGEDVTVHAVGHSAGSIFHAHFVPRALAAGVGKFDTVSLLAPAVRVDTFEQTLLKAAEEKKIEELSVFTMIDAKEADDNCFKIYRKSLLYLVSRSFEPERDAAIIGMEKYLRASKRSFDYLNAHPDRLVLSPIAAHPRRSSNATTHGGFDNDPLTMQSVAIRVTGSDSVTPFPVNTRAIEMDSIPVDAGGSRSIAPAKTALCIGVNAYEEPGDQLHGCVADANAWSTALSAAGFTTEVMVDGAATRTGILSAMLNIVTEAKAGDVVAIQFAGHGTYVKDIDGDEDDDAGPMDEAICPVDFRTGSLIIDDDLAQIWDVIPEGVAVTLLFDSCHSGTANRGGRPNPPPPTPGARPRLIKPDKALEDAYERERGVPVDDALRQKAREVVLSAEPSRARNTTHSRPTVTRREVLVSACLPNEVAMEDNGQGVFTGAALAVLARGEDLTNRAFVDAVIAQLGVRTQTPQLTADDALAARPLFAPAVVMSKDVVPPLPPGGGVRAVGKRTAAIVSILRATADLLEEGAPD